MDLIESEGFRNQAMTEAAAARLAPATREGRKRSLVLQLDDREQLALDFLGGAKALRALLAPAELCLCCRAAAAEVNSPLAALCGACSQRHVVTSPPLSDPKNDLK